jgi:beta-glucanase (GH16 family)
MRSAPFTRSSRRRWRAAALAGSSILALAVPLALSGSMPAAEAAVPPAPSGFSTVFSDDFGGAAGSPLDASKWMYATGHGYAGGAANWGTGQIEDNTDSTANVYQTGTGQLAIKPIRDAAGNWTSGRVETRRTDLAAPAGGVMRVEASLRQPNVTTASGAGYWPAFWMLGGPARPAAATNWPSVGEIDVMESTNGRSDVFQTLHCGVWAGGPCNETTGIGTGERACPACTTAFHQFGVEVDRSVSPEQIRFYLDGALSHTISANQVDATTWADAVHHGYFLILNVAIGGGFPDAFGGGPFASTVSGAPMLVDYVTVATKGPAAAAGTRIIGPAGKCVDVVGASTGITGARIQITDCQVAARDQLWTWNGQTLRTLTRCLDVTGAGTANKTPVQLYDCNDTAAQNWVQQANGSLRNPASGRCLASPGGATFNGSLLHIYDCNGTAGQHFTKS